MFLTISPLCEYAPLDLTWRMMKVCSRTTFSIQEVGWGYARLTTRYTSGGTRGAQAYVRHIGHSVVTGPPENASSSRPRTKITAREHVRTCAYSAALLGIGKDRQNMLRIPCKETSR